MADAERSAAEKCVSSERSSTTEAKVAVSSAEVTTGDGAPFSASASVPSEMRPIMAAVSSSLERAKSRQASTLPGTGVQREPSLKRATFGLFPAISAARWRAMISPESPERWFWMKRTAGGASAMSRIP